MNKPQLYIESWEDVSLLDYMTFKEEVSDELPFFTKVLETLIFLSDDDSWEDEDSEYVLSVYAKNKWILEEPKEKTKPISLTIGEHSSKEMIPKPLSKLTLAEWIDMDSYIRKEEVFNLIPLIYRQTRKNKWEHIEYEPYQYSVRERMDLLLDTPITYCYSLIEEVIEYRNKILDHFEVVFQKVEDDVLTDEEKDGLNKQEISDLKKQIKKENRRKEFAWQRMIDELSGGNWSYSEAILNLPATYVFNMLAMKKIYTE